MGYFWEGTEGDGGAGHDYRHKVIDTRLSVKQNCSERRDPSAPRDMEGLTGFMLSMKETRRLGDLKRQKKAATSPSRTEQDVQNRTETTSRCGDPVGLPLLWAD